MAGNGCNVDSLKAWTHIGTLMAGKKICVLLTCARINLVFSRSLGVRVETVKQRHVFFFSHTEDTFTVPIPLLCNATLA